MKNREIKFRAWVKPGKMVYDVVPFQWDYCINRMFHKCISSNGSGFLGSGGSEATFELNGYSYVTEDKDCLMEFTGLKDKNGKEIYEGDILSVCNGSINGVPWMEKNMVVKYFLNTGFNIHQFMWADNGDITMDNTHWCVVIGNVFEHPHLIETTN